MESVLNKGKLVILSTGQYWLIFNGEKGMSDREGHGNKAVVYKSHFLPLIHSVVQRHQQIHWLINHVYSEDPSLCSLCPYVKYEKCTPYVAKNISFGQVTILLFKLSLTCELLVYHEYLHKSSLLKICTPLFTMSNGFL